MKDTKEDLEDMAAYLHAKGMPERMSDAIREKAREMGRFEVVTEIEEKRRRLRECAEYLKQRAEKLGVDDRTVVCGKIERLSMWDWTVLVAAWRYYENRHTIAANQFPGDIVERYWGKVGMETYGDEVRDTIARQFALVDHGSHGEMDWDTENPMFFSDTRAWRKFYWFCRTWADRAFVKVTVSNGELTEVVETFAANGRVYPKDKYMSDPGREFYVPDEFIVKEAE